MRSPCRSELVVDASVFIALLSLSDGKTLLKNLSEIYDLITTEKVVEEVKSVREELLEAIKGGLVRVNSSVPGGLPSHVRLSLGGGEVSCLELCMHLRGEGKDVRCALDDRKARNVANQLGIEVKGTIGLLKELRRRGYLTKERLIPSVTSLRVTVFDLR